MTEANEVTSVPVGVVPMLDIDRVFIFRNYNARMRAASDVGQYYGWFDFVREALVSYASEELSA